MALAGVLIAMLVISARVQVHGDISSLLERQKADVYRVSMAHILDLTPQAFAVLRLPAAMAAVAADVAGWPSGAASAGSSC